VDLNCERKLGGKEPARQSARGRKKDRKGKMNRKKKKGKEGGRSYHGKHEAEGIAC